MHAYLINQIVVSQGILIQLHFDSPKPFRGHQRDWRGIVGLGIGQPGICDHAQLGSRALPFKEDPNKGLRSSSEVEIANVFEPPNQSMVLLSCCVSEWAPPL